MIYYNGPDINKAPENVGLAGIALGKTFIGKLPNEEQNRLFLRISSGLLDLLDLGVQISYEEQLIIRDYKPVDIEVSIVRGEEDNV